MKITRAKGLTIAAALIAAVVYTVIVFVTPFEKTGALWTAYGFTMLAIFLALGVGLSALGKEGMKSKFYGFPVFYVAWIYAGVQFFAGILEILIKQIGVRYSIVINVVLLGLCLVGLIGASIGKEEIERVDQAIHEKTIFV